MNRPEHWLEKLEDDQDKRAEGYMKHLKELEEKERTEKEEEAKKTPPPPPEQIELNL